MIFGGRPSYEKGLADALITFSNVAKRVKDIKLVITGKLTEGLFHKIKHVCKKT